MKNHIRFYGKRLFFAIIFALGLHFTVSAQLAAPFNPRLPGGNIRVKGDVTILSNNILNTRIVGPRQRGTDPTRPENAPWNPNDSYNDGTANNQRLPMAYIDIDSDASTFSSSSATLTAPTCSRVVYAGLYWGGTYPFNEGNSAGNTDSNNPYPVPGDTNPANDYNRDLPYESVKFMVPGGTYVDIGPGSPAIFDYQKIYDKDGDLDRDGNTDPGLQDVDLIHSPYLNYANVTHLLAALGDNPNGDYTVANVVATLERKRGGNLGGWTLVVIYENPTLASKYISTFDGMAAISSGYREEIFSYNGFRTLPAPIPVNASIGVAAMEGDRGTIGPAISFKAASTPTTATPDNGFTALSNTLNPVDNFFNSTITYNDAYVTARNPASENTLGWDVDVFNLDNPLNGVLPNDETNAEIKISLPDGGDITYLYLNTIAVDIIEPEIILEKRVEDIAGNDITGMGVNLGQTLDYVLSFQNRGNDSATNYTIRDVLPVNTTFISVDVSGSPGVTHLFDSVNNTVTFTVPDNLVEEGDTEYEIRLRVRVAENCFDFIDACTDLIQNLAFSTYSGVLNTITITDDPSVTSLSNCGLPTPGATNFLLDDLENCNYTRTVQLCGSNVVLDAGDGFDAYTWYLDTNGNNAIDPGIDTVITDSDPDSDPSTFLANQVGTYMVDKDVADPCKGFQEIIIVELFGSTQINPISALINDPTNTVDGQVLICPNGLLEELPEIFLCGLNDSELIQINIPDAIGVEWEQLDETSCTGTPPPASCPNRDNTCTWNNVGMGSDFMASSAGQYRVTINYLNGCFSRFYFNVFQNTLDIQYNTRDIVCQTPGNITITNLGAGYGYQLVEDNGNADPNDDTILIPFSAGQGPSFNFNAGENGIYRIDIVQLDGMSNPIPDACIFSTRALGILERDVQVNINTTPATCNTPGTIEIGALNVFPNYTYELWLDDGTPAPAPPTPDPYQGLHPGGTFIDDETAQPNNNHTFNASEGDYFVVTRTDDGCIDVQSVNVAQIPDPTVSALTAANIGCSDGTIELTANGGVPGYSYAIWSIDGVDQHPTVGGVPQIPPSAFQSGANANIFTFSPGQQGDYIFIVVDSNNCFNFSNAATIVNNGPTTIDSIDETRPSCSGENGGELTIVVSGGNAPYQYSIDNGTTYQSTNTFVGLNSGSYTIRVLDSSGCDVNQPYSLNEPFPLSASAGVSRDITCDPLNGAEVRITNVVGGTPPYEYSFDGGANWGASSVSNLFPGNYVVLVRDVSCSFTMNVTVDSLPISPDVSLTPEISYNCDGTGTITASPSVGGYDYRYALDGVFNTPEDNNVFTNVAPGTYTVTTYYLSQTPPTPSVLLTEDFGSGATIPSPNTIGYNYEDQTPNPPGDANSNINDFEYSVTSDVIAPFGTWLSPIDHTTGTRASQGRYLVMNVGTPTPTQVIYSKEVNDIIPNRGLDISFFVMNLLRQGTSGLDPDLTVELREIGTGTIIQSIRTGAIPKNTGNTDWRPFNGTLNPGPNTSLEFVIRSEITGNGGNDFALDDILIFQVPEICELFVETPVTVEPAREFAASFQSATNISCNGLSDGTITFTVENFNATAGFEYSIDGGTNWILEPSSPVTVSGLAAGTTRIDIRKADEITCATFVERALTEPTALSVTAMVNPQITCNIGATITATPAGGTGPYIYQLEDDAANIIAGFDFSTNGSNAVFTNIIASGDYVVRIRDINTCESISAEVTVSDYVPLTFDVTPTACYTGASNAQIAVTVTAGNGGYQFRSNGGPWLSPNPATPSSYTFTGLVNGSFTIEVRDQFGCSDTDAVTIQQQILANAVLNADLTCSNDAQITINASGGFLAPAGDYTYEWSNTSTGPWNTSGIVGNVFTTNADGAYFFRVSDDTVPTACSLVTNAIAVSAIVQPQISTVVPTNILCNALETGALDVTINTAFGRPPFTIEVLNTDTSFNYGNQASGLPAGNYEVRVTDDKGCVSDPFLATITQPDPIAFDIGLVPIRCSPSGMGTDQGSITVENITGGTAGFTYYLTGNNGYSDNFSATTGQDHTFTILNFGIYEVVVEDSNGCIAREVDIIASPPDDLDIDVSAVTTDCTVGGQATVTVSAPVPSSTYRFGILDQFTNPYSSSFQPPTVPGGASTTFTNLTPGVTYTFVVHDTTTDCYYFESAIQPIDSPSSMVASLDAVNNVSCVGSDDGSVTLSVSGYDAGATDIAYEVFIAQNNVPYPALPLPSISGSEAVTGASTTITNVGPLEPGIYYILLREVGGMFDRCTIATDPFTIDESTRDLDLDVNSPKNDTCEPNAGVIAASGRFGTAPYEYQYLVDTAPAPLATDPGWITNTTANVESGDYTVYVKDSFGCIRFQNITVGLDPEPDISLTIADECVADGSFEVIVTLDTPSLSPYSLSINGGAFQNISFNPSNQYAVTNLSSGVQTIEIRDLNGCSEVENISIHPPLQATANLSKLLDCTASPNAEITFEVLNGSSGTLPTNYQFRVDGPTPLSSVATNTAMPTNPFVWNGASEVGNYTVYIIDAARPSCPPLSFAIEVPPLVVPVLNAPLTTDVTCFGDADGTITISTSSTDAAPYLFEITSADGVVTSILPTSTSATSATFTGLAPTTTAAGYVVTATGEVTTNNCSVNSGAIIIAEPIDIAVAINAPVQFGCTAGNSPNNAEVSVDVANTAGGSGTYVRFRFENLTTGNIQDGSNPVYAETNYLGGTIDIQVFDDNGCVGATSETIAPFVEIANPTVNTAVEVTCTPGNDAQIEVGVTVNPGTATPNLEYVVTGINVPFGPQTINSTNLLETFAGLGAGNYDITITNLDTGCVINTVHTVDEPEEMNVVATKLTDEECLNNGVDDGSFDFTITNYTGSFDYQVFDTGGSLIIGRSGSGTTGAEPIITNLAGGTYYIEVTQTQAPFCVERSNVVTIIAPDALISAVVNIEASASCANDQGALLIDPEGGEGPYTILLQNTTTSQSYTQTNVEAHIFTGLSAGDFDITITDAYNCVYTENITLVRPDDIAASLTASTLACYNDNDGSVTVSVAPRNVTPLYEYALNIYADMTSATPLQTSVRQSAVSFGGLGAGFYSVSVTDDTGCVAETNRVEIVNPTQVSAQLIRTSPLTCTAGVEFELSAAGGSGSYEYSADNATFVPMIGNSVTIPNADITGPLGDGAYQYFVRDAVNGCDSVASNEITEDPIMPLSLTVDSSDAFINCTDESTATIYAEADGGLGNYQYALYTDPSLSATSRAAGPQAIGEFANLSAGTYYVSVTSADCTTAPQQVVIDNPTPLSYTETVVNVTCDGEDNGSITVTLSGGAGGYQYAISPNLDRFDTENMFTDLAPGDYTIFAQDQNGCFEVLNYTITEPDPIDISTVIITHELCSGDADGAIEIDIIGGTAPYRTSLNSTNEADFVADRLLFDNLPAGTHVIFVRDANDCEENLIFEIDPGVNLNAIVTPIYECTGNIPENRIEVMLEDPSVANDVMYAIDSTDPMAMQLNADFTNLAPGIHDLYIIHANGCMEAVRFEIQDFEPLTLSVGQGNINEIVAYANGGLEDYTFYFGDINNGADNSFYINRTDTYTVRVVDQNGCETMAEIFIEFIDIEIPNFFTPDGDGLADLWVPQNLDGFPNVLMIIFDRYGRELYRMRYGDTGWNGKYQQTDLPTGDYWYVIKLQGENDDREFVGHFTLYR